MKTRLALVIAFLVGCSPVKHDHPIIGKWSITLPNGCSETYEFHPNDTTDITSGSEVAQSRFTISNKLEKDGFYHMRDETTKNNGGTDCGGSNTPVGDVANLFVYIQPSGDEMYFCFEPSTQKCFGPLRRVSQ